ncbi:MAG: efflux RND transporter periplasmic adaptor subunit [Proteobacteria bacterium]|nr:efflux RND transporter periplasmic adaptor subunit [Pseudomonadota bacterium]
MPDDEREEITRILGLGDGGRRRSFLIAGAVLAPVLAGLVWLGIAAYGDRGNPVYRTAPVVRDSFAVTVTATGTVEPTTLVEVSSQLSGEIDSVHVDFNDNVEVGTVLATLDTRKLEAQLAIARASVETAKARVAVGQADFEIARTLERRGVTPHQTFIAQEAALKRAEAELRSAEADRDLADATLSLHRTDLDNACICSPIRGVVLDRAVDPGQIIAAALSAPVLFTIAGDLREMQVQVAIDEADIGRVAVGDTARFTVDAFRDRHFPAEISELRFAAEIVNGVVTYKAILNVDNSGMLLRPGMTATAEITVAEVTDALVVPNAALRFAPPQPDAREDDDRSGLLGMLMPTTPQAPATAGDGTIWVLRDGQPVETAIETGETDGEVTEILGGDLAEGELVITGRSDD